MKNARTLLETVESLTDFYESGTSAIKNAFDIFSEKSPCSYEEFEKAIDLREIDSIEFLYSSEAGKGVDDSTKIQWGYSTFSKLIK